MNLGISILVFLIVLISIFGATLIVLLIVYYPTIYNSGKISCDNADTSQLQDVSDQPRLCNGKIVTNDRLVIDYSPSVIISPIPYSYTIACASMCTQIVNGECLDSQGNIVDAYSTCLEKLAPSNCTGNALPVGYSGNTLYYVERFVQNDEYISIEPCN